MPMREIQKKYTKSEMFIMSWRSREISYNMRKGSKKQNIPTTTVQQQELPDYGLTHPKEKQPHVKITEHPDSYELPKDINNGVAIPKSFFNEEGDLDLSRTTGNNALRYLNAVGLNITPVFR